MNTRHTAGKWAVSKTVFDYAIYSDNNDGKDIAAVFEYSRSIPYEEAAANAKLIAASPLLLEALTDLLYYNEFGTNEMKIQMKDKAKEAIIAATYTVTKHTTKI